MPNKTIWIILNPISGRGKSLKLLPKIEEYLNEQGVRYQVVFTEYRYHAEELVKELKQRTDIKLINGLYPSEIPLGYIPAGSGNDFAREMNIPKDPILAIKSILDENLRTIDIGKINGHYFINVASMGFDGEVARIANNSKLKNILGSLIYVYGVVRALWGFKPSSLTVTIDDQEYFYKNVWIMAVANNRYYGGGMKICPDAVNDDGKFDICIIKDLTRLRLLKLFPTIFSGKHLNYPEFVEVKKGKNILISTEKELTIQADGELLSNINLSFRNINQGITILH